MGRRLQSTCSLAAAAAGLGLGLGVGVSGTDTEYVAPGPAAAAEGLGLRQGAGVTGIGYVAPCYASSCYSADDGMVGGCPTFPLHSGCPERFLPWPAGIAGGHSRQLDRGWVVEGAGSREWLEAVMCVGSYLLGRGSLVWGIVASRDNYFCTN